MPTPTTIAGEGPRDPRRNRTQDPTQIPIREIMQTQIAVSDVALPAEQLLESLVEEGIGGAPVVDAEGHLLGIVSKTDLLCAWRELGESRDRRPLTAADVMMPVVFALTEDSTIAEAAALMAYEGVHRLPIVDGQTRVVGIVTTLDLSRWIAQSAGLHAPDIREIEIREV
ncbi:MAG: CBS domain-containing protein [Myxococcota bacterium]|nr:CBS domain-containing protein [Myxococcota bacterium]